VYQAAPGIAVASTPAIKFATSVDVSCRNVFTPAPAATDDFRPVNFVAMPWIPAKADVPSPLKPQSSSFEAKA
jgi:hypothetical protein